jgi:hypothetical protein
MKKTNGQLPAPTRVSARVEFTEQQWKAVQLEAGGRFVTVDVVLAERRDSETKTLEVELPASFLRLVKQLLASRSIPPSHLSRGLTSALLATYLNDDCALWSGYVYRDRRAAEVAATRVFARERWRSSLVLKYRDGRTVADDIFRNPLRHLNAA